MAKPQRCEVCDMFYNAAEYSSCPYCSSKAAQKRQETPKRTTGLFGLFRGRVKTGEMPRPDPEDVKKPEYDSDDMPAGSSSDSSKQKHEQEEKPKETSAKTEPEQQKKQTPQEVRNEPSLEAEVIRGSRTVGKYISAKDGTSVSPVVGWLVGVKGENYGRSFMLKSGKNRVGRSHEMDVKLMNDDSVSRTCVAVIVYDRKANEFSVLPGESDSLCYLNEKAVYDRQPLRGYDLLEFGDSELNQYLFVPLCGEQFRWRQEKEIGDRNTAENEESSQ